MSGVVGDGEHWHGEDRLEETKRVARVIKLAALLTAQPGRWRRASLSARYEVGERQIARDLELLRGCGYAIRHTPGGYIFEHAPTLPALSLSVPEVLTLALAAGLARDAGDVDTATLGAALAKLEALVPPGALGLLRRELARTGEDDDAARRAEVLQALQQARMERRQARIVYETGMRGGARSERVIEPYHLQRYGRFWLIVAHDHMRGAVRDFKLDRIKAVTLLDGRYTIPESFDLAAYRGATWGVLRGEDSGPADVELLFTARAGRWAKEEDRGIALRFEEQADGNIVARMCVGVTDEMVRWILGFGSDCRVLAPDWLRERVRTMAAETAQANDDNQSINDSNRREAM